MSEDVFYGGEKPITKHQVNDELDEGHKAAALDLTLSLRGWTA